jgi:hypothetical protein
MQIYTTIILNSTARPTADYKKDCKSFKSFDSAVEYIVDFLADEGFIEMDEVPNVEKALRDDHVYVLSNTLEFYIDENELCEW